MVVLESLRKGKASVRTDLVARSVLAALLFSLPMPGAQASGNGTLDLDAPTGGQERESSGQHTLWIIPHTHWEGAVFKTREEYLEIGLPHILKALNLLKAYPQYRFVLDQVCYVKPFLERYPEEARTFRKFVSEKRLELVGANDVMLDVNIPSGESWVRQALYGKTYYREKLGVDVKVGWALDTFGHHAQMPQLLKRSGYASYWFQRGVHSTDTPSEFLWQGLDGTRIPAFWLPRGYGLFYHSPKNPFEFDRFSRNIWDQLGHFSRWPDRVALAGADVSEPEETLPVMVEEFNRKPGAVPSLRFGVPTDFEAIVAQRANPPVVTGELNPVFQGVYSSRIELKQWIRDLERLLTSAEKLSALGSWVGTRADQDKLTQAWEPVLFNEAHDLASGTIVDKVYEDTIRGYQFSKSLAEEMVDSGLEAIASKVDTRLDRQDGVPFLVFNPLGWTRSDFAEVGVGFSDPGLTSVEIFDPEGHTVPIQFLEAHRYADGSLEQVKIAFIAHDVPALGYSVYRMVPGRLASPGTRSGEPPGARTSSTRHEDTGSLENDYYRVTFNLWTGEMTSLRVKADNWEALGREPGNIIARELDGGDLWELYGTLSGGRHTAMTREQALPAPGRAHFSNEYVGGNGATLSGPVFSEFHVSHPFGEGNFATTVRLYPGIRRIDFRTQILNNDKGVRYRALFPTSITHGQRFDEIPFGALERPVAQEFPAQNWIDYGDRTRGIALINRGLPGNNVARDTLVLSLMRSARITAYPFFGGYEPGVSSDLGLELGKQLAFDYALLPHAGDWREAGVYRAGLEFNNPLIVRKVAQHGGTLPKRWGLFEVSHSNVVTSALKPGRDGRVVLRVYEASGKATAGIRIKFQARLASVEETNLIEEAAQKLDVRNNTLAFDLGPYEIKTFRFGVGLNP